MSKLAEVYIFPNGQMMAFGESGEQVPEYQGHYLDVWNSIAMVFDGTIQQVESANWNGFRGVTDEHTDGVQHAAGQKASRAIPA